ncbi:MAG: ABC transporter permease [Hyphomicrobiaceae bacterium]
MIDLTAHQRLTRHQYRLMCDNGRVQPTQRETMVPHALNITQRPDGLVEFGADGPWTAEHSAKIDAAISAALVHVSNQTRVSLHLAGITQFDTYGAWLVEKLLRGCRQKGVAIDVDGLDARFKGLADTVRLTADAAAPVPGPTFWLRALTRMRRAVDDTLQDAGILLSLLGKLTVAMFTSLARPATFRLASTVHQLDRVAWQAVPIILLMTFLIGGIIAQQGFFHFRKFGADQYVVDMVGILILREIGVLLVAIMVAGRSGSAYTAELGSMKMREEIDALRTMGLDPIAVLILPRILALILALPALTFLGSMAALYGGGLVAWLYGDMNPSIFIDRLRDAVSLTHFKVGLIKAPFMAAVIGIVACSEGLKVRGSAESLGLRTTASVVKSIFLVIVLDGLFAIYFSAIGW